MAVISVPTDLDRVNKSLEWFGQSTNCLCDLCVMLCYFHEKNNMLIVILWAVPR